MPNTNPVIVVHGSQGSWLKDEYPVNYQNSILWTGALRRNFGALHLHPDDATVDADPRRLVQPHQAVPLIYEPLVEEIREELEETHPYVYAFTYDWRKDNRVAADDLARFVDRALHIARVHEQARRPRARGPNRVTLIGHSMGGLVIKWYVAKVLGAAQAARKIDRIITIATPYRGSLKAVEALLPGARNLFGFENNKSMRHAARTMPGVYQLLPTWPEAVVRHSSGKPLDVFDPRSWQDSLVASLRTRFPRQRFFRNMLADAKAFTSVVSGAWPRALRRRVYSAFGVDTETWWQVRVDTAKGNFYRFDTVETDCGNQDLPGGDGTVHTVSSIPPALARTHHKRDRKELKDIFAGHHANMPNHNGVQDWVLGVLNLNIHSAAAFTSPR